MITEGVIITSIICLTILCMCFIIGYYSNKETKEEKLKNIRGVVNSFKDNYIKLINNKFDFTGNANDILCLINNIKNITF